MNAMVSGRVDAFGAILNEGGQKRSRSRQETISLRMRQ